MEVPSTWKYLSGGMLVTLRLMLAGPAACVPTGSSTHSSSSTKPFEESGLEHQGTQGQPGSHRPGCMPSTNRKSALSLRMVSLHPCLLPWQVESSMAGTNFTRTMTQETGRAHAGSRRDRVVSLDTKQKMFQQYHLYSRLTQWKICTLPLSGFSEAKQGADLHPTHPSVPLLE